MKLKTTLGTIMTLALILLIGATSIKTAFAKKVIEVDIGYSRQPFELASYHGAYDLDKGVLKGIDVTPNNKGVEVGYDKMYDMFMVEFKKLGTYKLKFKFANGKSEVATFKVLDFIKAGKAMVFEFYKDEKGNDVFDALGRVDRPMPNVNIKFGKKTVIKNVAIGNIFTYVFKKGELKKIKFNPKDIKKIKYEIVKGEYDSYPAHIDEKKIEGGMVTAIKLHDSTKGYEGYLTIGDNEYGNDITRFAGELYTIKLDKKASGEWIELEKGIPEDRLLVTNHLYKKLKKKK